MPYVNPFYFHLRPTSDMIMPPDRRVRTDYSKDLSQLGSAVRVVHIVDRSLCRCYQVGRLVQNVICGIQDVAGRDWRSSRHRRSNASSGSDQLFQAVSSAAGCIASVFNVTLMTDAKYCCLNSFFQRNTSKPMTATVWTTLFSVPLSWQTEITVSI